MEKKIVCAGGCFWGEERVFQMLNGTETETGYANGHVKDPTYERVCRGDTGYQEAVMVTYDPDIVSLRTLMKAYFLCVKAEQKDGQGNDIGDQYRAGVYYLDESDREELEEIFAEERRKHRVFYPELGRLKNFVRAEEYHQDYLIKHPDGYCHIAGEELEAVKKLNH